ncbi:ATP-grasp domain-containing protein [Frankia sp. ACN1ag]|uniref:ATP-grasp domain-containing protein n=1 Tax=Frankia sp. ACN1ag TaxID=102891 RepID=UPI0006DD373D|nr:ATP-grasp domain-containing protein [Frankia sp. ACN1ag]KQC35931.1 carboxylase [Frankia sp. ACN1ag]
MTEGSLLVYSPLNEPRRPALTRLAELHPRVVLLAEDDTDVPSWADELLADVVRIDRLDAPAAIRTTRDLLARRGGAADGIVSLSETGLAFCSAVAAELGLPFTPLDVLERARDKSRMRAAFAEHGLPTVRFRTAERLDEALAIAADIGYPVVLKPLLAGGSLFVWTVHDPAELAAAFDDVLRGGARVVAGDPLVHATFRGGAAPRLLVEQLIRGRRRFASSLDLPVGEVSVEGSVVGGEVRVLARHDKPLPADGPFFEEVLWSSPSRLPADLLARVDDVAAGAVRALGLRDCVFHAEMRTTDTGPVLLEVAARMGGGPIFRSARLAHGVDLVETMVRIATGAPAPSGRPAPDPDPDPRDPDRPRHAVMTFGLFADEGMLRAIEGLDEVRSHPDVVEVCVYEHPGTYIRRAPRSDHCTVHVMVAAADFATAEDLGRWAQKRIRFVTGAQ